MDWFVGLGTVAALAVSMWAARSARTAATASKESAAETKRLVEVEIARDAYEADRQAKRVSVDMAYHPIFHEATGEWAGQHVHLVFVNGGPDPISTVRVQIGSGSNVWGPQPIGTVLAGGVVQVRARVLGEIGREYNGAVVRFRDVERVAWIVTPGGRAPEHDPSSDDDWIARTAAWTKRASGLDLYQQGSIEGAANMGDVDEWLQQTSLLTGELTDDEVKATVQRLQETRRLLDWFINPDRS